MCSCTWNFTCSRCAGTPFDPRYLEDEPEPVSDDYFYEMAVEPSAHPIAMLGESDE